MRQVAQALGAEYQAALDNFTGNPAASADADLARALDTARAEAEKAKEKHEKAVAAIGPMEVALGNMDKAIERMEREAYNGLTRQAEKNIADRTLMEYNNMHSSSIDFDVERQSIERMQKTLSDYRASVDAGLLNVVEKYRADTGIKMGKYSVGTVSERAATDIDRVLAEEAGVNVNLRGYSVTIDKEHLAHIERRHGENGEADHSMSNANDIARIPYILANYDEVQIVRDNKGNIKLNRQYANAPMVQFSKNINGTYYVVQAVFENRSKNLPIISAYIGKAGQNAGGHVLNAVATTPVRTPENAHDQSGVNDGGDTSEARMGHAGEPALFITSKTPAAITDAPTLNRVLDVGAPTLASTSDNVHSLLRGSPNDNIPQSGETVNTSIRQTSGVDTSRVAPFAPGNDILAMAAPSRGAVDGDVQKAAGGGVEKIHNPVTIANTLARRLGIGADTGTRKMGVRKPLPKNVLGYYQQGKGYFTQRSASDYHTAMHALPALWEGGTAVPLPTSPWSWDEETRA